jgi:hypothetical protein
VLSRIGFLLRLTGLKLAAFFTFIALALYAPSTTNLLLDGASGTSKLIAQGTEDALQAIGGAFGDYNALMPKKGAVELLLRYVGMDKVILFIGLAIGLYIVWMLLIASGRGVVRRFDRSGNPQRQLARVQAEPPR